MEVVLATANPDKARELRELFEECLGSEIVLLERPSWLGEVEETGATIEANARLKAEAVADAVGLPAVADDTGLEVEVLGGAPGVFSARYAGPHATYADNVAKLLAALEARGARDAATRRARFVTVAVVAFPKSDGRPPLVERGCVEGVIATEPRGRFGFGYDVVFVPDEGDGRTFAEMRPQEKHALSHRARAVRALATGLRRVFGPVTPRGGC
jgi:XTP/dITP diphosphohydrolase